MFATRMFPRKLDDNMNPLMPPRGFDPLGLRDDSHEPPHVGAGGIGAGGLKENANTLGTVFMITGGILGSLAFYKGAVAAGLVTATIGLVGGAVLQSWGSDKGA